MIKPLIIILLLDQVYFALISKIIHKQMKDIQGTKMKVKYLPAIISYSFLLIGLKYFIMDKNETISKAFLLGTVIYGVFDSTNLAIINKWTYKFSIIDTLWGGTLFAFTTFLTRLIEKKI